MRKQQYQMLNVPRLSFSVEEGCAATGLGRTKFYELVKNGEIQSIRIGRRILIPREELQRFLEQSANNIK